MFYFVTSGDRAVCSFLQLYHNEPCSTVDKIKHSSVTFVCNNCSIKNIQTISLNFYRVMGQAMYNMEVLFETL